MAGWEERFGDYVERLGDVLGHADRRAPLRSYTTGLLLPGERKSVEPTAARVDPFRVGRRTSPCTTSSPRPPGTTPPC
jgi:SRSO17 transposase